MDDEVKENMLKSINDRLDRIEKSIEQTKEYAHSVWKVVAFIIFLLVAAVSVVGGSLIVQMVGAIMK